MKHAYETELKALLSREDFERLASFYQPLEFVEQHNFYFITDDPKHYAFRIRTRNGEQLFTLKHKENGKTVEYEKVFDGRMEDDQDIMQTLASFNIFPPFRIFGELVTQRAVYENELAELCFDINTYNGITDYEVEYEIKKYHKYKKAFREILGKADIPFVLNKTSKYKRCLRSRTI